MAQHILLTDRKAVEDLRVFLERAKRLDPDGAVRLQGFPGGLACYVAPLYPSGLMDAMPTVLGVRTIPIDAATADPAGFDAVTAISAMLERLAYLDRTEDTVLQAPPATLQVAWSAVTPPRSGWEERARVPECDVKTAAKSGVEQVAAGVPDIAGEIAVGQLRASVWGRRHDVLGEVPAGTALAADGLGFLTAAAQGSVRVLSSGVWMRMSAAFGDVLVKPSAWS